MSGDAVRLLNIWLASGVAGAEDTRLDAVMVSILSVSSCAALCSLYTCASSAKTTPFGAQPPSRTSVRHCLHYVKLFLASLLFMVDVLLP